MITDRSNLVVIAFCDPAGNKTSQAQKLKRTSARSAVVCIGVDELIRIFVLHAWAKRCSTDELTDEIYKVNALYKPKIFGVEANAMQSLYGNMIAREAKQRKVRIVLAPVYQPTHVTKNWRIRTIVQPVVAEGRLFLGSEHYELSNEIAVFPMSPVVDLIDALASAISLAPRRPVQQQRSEEADAYASYLRNTGAPADYIVQAMASFKRGEQTNAVHT